MHASASQDPSEPSGDDLDGGAEVGAAGAAETGGGGAMGPAGGSGSKFEVGETVILFNGSLCYEAEVVQAAEGKKGGGVGRKKEGSSDGPSYQYLIRYIRWPRRPEEWVGEAFVLAWTEALAKAATNRPPRKLMWVEHKGPSASTAAAKAAAAAAGGALGEEGKADGEEEGGQGGSLPEGKRGRGGKAEEEAAEGKVGKRARRPTEKMKEGKDQAKDQGREEREAAAPSRGRSATPLSDPEGSGANM